MKSQDTSRPLVLIRRRGKRAAAQAEQVRMEEKQAAKKRQALAKSQVVVNPKNLRPTNSAGTPDFVVRGYYVDYPFTCKSCGASQNWTATQQQWWYESARGDVWTVAVLCRPCRVRERTRKEGARKVHLEGLASKTKSAA
jgi:hypothetical protein